MCFIQICSLTKRCTDAGRRALNTGSNGRHDDIAAYFKFYLKWVSMLPPHTLYCNWKVSICLQKQTLLNRVWLVASQLHLWNFKHNEISIASIRGMSWLKCPSAFQRLA